MKNKLGIIGGLILSLAIAGSAFASTGNSSLKATKTVGTAKVLNIKNTKPKKHRKHKKHHRKWFKKTAAKIKTPTK